MNPIQWVIGLVQWFATGIQFALEHLHAAFATVAPLRAIGAFGLAIIVTTLAIRLLLFPLFGWQLNNARRLQEQQRRIQPQIQEVRRKYKKDPRKTAEELQRVYRENNMSPFSAAQGCLPALVQAPVLYALYYAIRQSTQHLHADLGFLWVSDVSKSARDICCSGKEAQLANVFGHLELLIIPALAALATFISMKMMMPPLREDMTDQEKAAASTSRMMAMILPIGVMVMGYLLPQGIALYWVTQSIFMIGQQYYKLGWGSLEVPSWVPGHARSTPLSQARSASRAAVLVPAGERAVTAGGSERPPVSSGAIKRGETVKRGSGSERPARTGSGRKRRR